MAKPLGKAANCNEACFGKGAAPAAPASVESPDSTAGRSQSERDIAEQERRASEKRARDAEFIGNRDPAASTLKGNTGASGLKGSGTEVPALKELHGKDIQWARVDVSSEGMAGIPEIPVTWPEGLRKVLIAKRQPVALRKLSLMEKGERLNKECVRLEAGSKQHQDCLARKTQFEREVRALGVEMDELIRVIDATVRTHVIKNMSALAKRLGWQTQEQARLANALSSVSLVDSGASSAQIRSAWREIAARGPTSDVAKAAAGGDGPGFPGAGTQSFGDCTIFALANAAGLPYGVVAARAGELIRQGEWRGDEDRANPQKMIEQSGLMWGEVVMLAEAFGQVEVVAIDGFADVLKNGSRIIVSVAPYDGIVDHGHAVVLSRTFQHRAETWYEMIDSNQRQNRRRYVSSAELRVVLQGNGAVYRPEAGSTPRLLR